MFIILKKDEYKAIRHAIIKLDQDSGVKIELTCDN